MRTFQRSVAIYIAVCREVHDDDGTSHLAATRLISLTAAAGALLRVAAVVAVSLWILWRVGVRLTNQFRAAAQALTGPYHRLEISLLVIGIGVRVLLFGLKPAPIRVR